MPVTLDQIVAATRVRVAECKRSVDIMELERQAAAHQPRGFRQSLQKAASAIIAELKKASPSKGVIREKFEITALAKSLQKGGAAALSVLTEEEFFLGSLANLREASAATSLPCLRKDFIVDEFQLLEARANCADAVLLLASVLDDAALTALHRYARALELDVLCEAHDEQELRRALAAGCDLVGVNSRDLRTFAVDLNTPLRLASMIPAGVLRVAESGIASGQDIARLQAAGYQAFLIGETVMRAADPGTALKELIAQSRRGATLAAK